MLVESAADDGELERMVARRVAGEPLEVIVGWAEFDGLRIVVEPGVFVPRRRTELLVAEAALAATGSVVVDLCCGSGAVGAALLARLPELDLELVASDIEPAAVRCARRNLEPRALVVEGDLFDPLPPALRGRIDIVVANAPYVPTEAIALMPPEARIHEPQVALDGGHDGLDLHRRVAAGAADWLTAGGHLLIETSEQQSSLTAAIFDEAGFDARVVHDDDLDGTVVIGTLRAGR